MKSLGNKGKLNSFILVLDIVGFVLVLVGAGLIRYAKEEIISILGGFVIAGGVTLLSITRLIKQ